METRPPDAANRTTTRKRRPHLVSLATGVGVFLLSIGLMQAIKSSAGGDAVSAPAATAQATQPGALSGNSGAGATGSGTEDDKAAATGARPAPATGPSTAVQIMGMPSVYIHVLNESAREQARLLAPALEQKGIALAGVKVVGAGPRSSDLRYFRPSEKAEAMRVQAVLLSLGLPAGQLKSISGFETSAVPRQFELWLVSDYKG